jgi:hypothetical protein
MLAARYEARKIEFIVAPVACKTNSESSTAGWADRPDNWDIIHQIAHVLNAII